jgi:hypothetical protein
LLAGQIIFLLVDESTLLLKFMNISRSLNYLISILALTPFCLLAQGARVVSSIKPLTKTPTVLLKWYSRELYYDEGVYVYRRTSSDLSWTRVSLSPIKRQSTIPESEMRIDPDLKDFVTIVNSSQRKDLQEDLPLLQIMLKTFQSNSFSKFLGICFEDVDLHEGIEYEYKVNKIVNGKEILLGISKTFLVGSYQPDPPVDSVSIFQKGKKIALNWKHDEERFYAVNIYRTNLIDGIEIKLNKQPLVLSKITDSLGRVHYPSPMFAEDKKLKEGERYSYEVAGVGFFENETKRSSPVEVAFEDITPPPAPKNLVGEVDSMVVNLKWESVQSPDLDHVRIYRSRKSDGPFDVVITPKKTPFDGTSFKDSLSTPGPYYYFIAAVDRVGNESHSNLVFIEAQDVFGPAKPEDLRIATDTGSIHLSWKMGNEADLAGYYLYRTVDQHDFKKYVLLNAEPLHANHFDERLPKNVKNNFFYYLIATDTSYNRSVTSEFVFDRMPDAIAPEKPFIKAVSYENDVIVVSWTPNLEQDLKGYNLFRSDSASQFSQLNINPIGREAFRFIDRTHTPNTEYHYYLQAFDSAGNVSINSNEVFAKRTTEEEELSEVGVVSLKLKFNKRKKVILASWTSNINTGILGYVLFKGQNETDLKPITGLISEIRFTEPISDQESWAYQVRCYSPKKVFYSKLITKK